MAVVCKAKQGEYLTKKEGGWVNPECAQKLGSLQNQHSGCAMHSKAGSHWLHIKMFPSVPEWALKQVTQKDSGISMLADVQILIGKGSEHLAPAVQGAQLHQEIRLETSRHPFHLILHEKCTQCGGVFAPLVMLGDLKHCLQDNLSPGATATLKSSFYSVPTKAGSFLPLQTSDLYLPNLGSMVVL